MLSTQLLDDFVEPDEALDLQREAILPDLHLLVEPQVFKLVGLPGFRLADRQESLSPRSRVPRRLEKAEIGFIP